MNLNTIIDAMERNGYEKAQGDFIVYEDGDTSGYIRPFEKISAACAVGQAALNLNRSAYEIEHFLSVHGLQSFVYDLNDTTQYSVSDIAKMLREEVILLGLDLDADIELEVSVE